ncbi:MAG: hypothetical protein M3R13_11985 [Armatimonadota bacterium]|nr:hypothetical protein [Armatimonadota bacterium]
MKKRRLLKLAAFLDTVPIEKFDMCLWAVSRRSASKTPQCATRACALGWATAIPEFNRAGLRLMVDAFDSTEGVVYFGDLNRFYAAEAFFDIDSDDAGRLFAEGSNDPKEKAKEIRALVRKS